MRTIGMMYAVLAVLAASVASKAIHHAGDFQLVRNSREAPSYDPQPIEDFCMRMNQSRAQTDLCRVMPKNYLMANPQRDAAIVGYFCCLGAFCNTDNIYYSFADDFLKITLMNQKSHESALAIGMTLKICGQGGLRKKNLDIKNQELCSMIANKDTEREFHKNGVPLIAFKDVERVYDAYKKTKVWDEKECPQTAGNI